MRDKLAKVMFESQGFSTALAKRQLKSGAAAKELSRTRLLILSDPDDPLAAPSDPDEPAALALVLWDEEDEAWSGEAEEVTDHDTLADALEYAVAEHGGEDGDEEDDEEE